MFLLVYRTRKYIFVLQTIFHCDTSWESSIHIYTMMGTITTSTIYYTAIYICYLFFTIAIVTTWGEIKASKNMKIGINYTTKNIKRIITRLLGWKRGRIGTVRGAMWNLWAWIVIDDGNGDNKRHSCTAVVRAAIP
jgi:hypothetical protein